jgi:hypothetical protein
VAAGTPCDDGNAATGNDQCDGNGNCKGTQPPSCGNGVCDPGEDCNCPDCAETEACKIESEQVKCRNSLVSQSNGRLSAQEADNIAAELLANGQACELLLEGESTIGGGCSLNRATASSGNWMGAALFCLATPLVLIPRRIRVRRRP